MLGGLLRRGGAEVVEARDMSLDAYANLFTYNGSQYLLSPFRAGSNRHLIGMCGPVYAVIDRRASVMGEARPTFQRFKKGRPDEFWSSPELDILHKPWPGGSFRQLVAICEADVAACGNSYWIRQGRELQRLEPEWITIVTEAVQVAGIDAGWRLVGYGVQRPGNPATYLEPHQVAHYMPGSPISSPYQGESWLAAVANDGYADVEMTRYKGNYLKNGAMPSLAVTYDPQLKQEQLEAFVPVFAAKFTGALNAGKVLHFLGGRDVKSVGATLDQLAFKAVQGAGETRIAAAAGVPAAVAGFSEGMQGSSLNAGNYVATRRLFADAKIRPLLGHFCDAFSNLVRVSSDSRLWYDDSDGSFFQEDVTDEAQIRLLRAQMIRTLIEGGYLPDAAVKAATNGDFDALIGNHTGLTSVQLQPPGAGQEPPTDGDAPSDGADTDAA